MSASKNLGKVFMTPKGVWNKALNYTKLDIVTNKVGKISCGYIATTDIEKNVEITDNRWLKLFELLDGDLTEEYKAVQTDVTNKATDVDTNKKAVDLIYSQMQKLYDVEISTTTPTNERTGLWINPDDISGVVNIPEIKDDEVSDVDTWSSKKIDNVTNSLKEDISNKITKFYASSQGETHLADSDDGKIMDMMLYGRSEQKQYSGKNLFTFSNGSRDINGVIFEAKDGIITAKGTSTKDYSSTYFQFNYPKDIFTIGETYTFSLNSNDENLSMYALYRENDATDYRPLFSKITKYATVKIPDNVDLIIRCVVDINATVNATATIQIEKGSTATSFEPYTGGVPSPNPDYPQEIKSVVNPTVKVCGKNLFQPLMPTTTVDGVTVTNNGDGTYTLNGTAIADATFRLDQSGYGKADNLKKYKGTYTFSRSNTSYDARVMRHNTWEQVMYLGIGSQSITKKIDIDDCFVFISTRKGTTYNNVLVDLQIELGSTPTAYEPYHEQAVTLPYTLNAIPVSSGGNVTIGGQQYIADYVDVERGKLVRHIKEKSDTISIAVTGSVGGLGSYDYDIPFIKNVICNITNIVYEDVNKGWASKQACISGSNAGELRVYLPVGNHNVKIIYELETQEEIDLTPEEIAAFKALATYYPTTNISINSEQLDGYTVFNYPISMQNGWNYVKQQIGDTREYIYDIDARTQDTDLQAAEAYVNSEYAVALTELEV